jgi:hypothetical protein
MTVMLSRRGVLRCLTGIIAAPAIVKASSLMKIVAATPLSFANNVLDMGGLPGDGSIWIVSWGEQTIFGFFPEDGGAIAFDQALDVADVSVRVRAG